MGTRRLEAFSDAVFAIIITIMLLEIKIPRGDSVADLVPLLPAFRSYALSFVYIGIYWNNHHHLLHVCNGVTGGVLWANLHLLFWLSLLPLAPVGWVRTNSRLYPSRCMAWCSDGRRRILPARANDHPLARV